MHLEAPGLNRLAELQRYPVLFNSSLGVEVGLSIGLTVNLSK
jgi:hypothetical protein